MFELIFSPFQKMLLPILGTCPSITNTFEQAPRIKIAVEPPDIVAYTTLAEILETTPFPDVRAADDEQLKSETKKLGVVSFA